jgi:hypothetical protein
MLTPLLLLWPAEPAGAGSSERSAPMPAVGARAAGLLSGCCCAWAACGSPSGDKPVSISGRLLHA